MVVQAVDNNNNCDRIWVHFPHNNNSFPYIHILPHIHTSIPYAHTSDTHTPAGGIDQGGRPYDINTEHAFATMVSGKASTLPKCRMGIVRKGNMKLVV